MKYLITVLFSLNFLISFGQSDASNYHFENDTALAKVLEGMTNDRQKDFIEEYKLMSADQRKMALALMNYFSSLPKSSKKELTQNIDTNYSNILALKNYFISIVPSDYAIYIEFKPPDKTSQFDENIDFQVFRKGKDTNELDLVFQEWSIELKSTNLDSLLRMTPLNREELQELKKYLVKANCISVSNIREFEIGFARSDMGKYSYLIFDKQLTDQQIEIYSNGCEYIFYKDNIVLKYGGGAIGPQCFPDSD